jgi:hypothetical protein
MMQLPTIALSTYTTPSEHIFSNNEIQKNLFLCVEPLDWIILYAENITTSLKSKVAK